jgi:hypothetical protein
VLLYGINPGQNPDILHGSNHRLIDSVRGFLSQGKSLIASEPWLKQGTRPLIDSNLPDRRPHLPGRSPYQKRVQLILHTIGAPDALVSNLLFVQTPDVNVLGQDPAFCQLLNSCWRVHEEILRCVHGQR